MRRRAISLAAVLVLVTGLFTALGGGVAATPNTSSQLVTGSSGFCGINLVYAMGARVTARVTVPTNTTPVGGVDQVTIQVDLSTIFGRFFNMGGAPWGPLPYVGFDVTGPNAGTATPSSGTVKTDANGRAFITYGNTTTTGGTDTVLVYWDMNNNGVRDCLEPSTVLSVTWEPGPVQSPGPDVTLTLSPDNQYNIADGVDTGELVATISGFDSSNPPPAGAKVLASSTGANNNSNVDMGPITCDATECTATLTLGPTNNTGLDTYTAFLDLDNSGAQNGYEPGSNAVTGTWATVTLAPLDQVNTADSQDTGELVATIHGFNTNNPLPAGAKLLASSSGANNATGVDMGAISCDATECTATLIIGPTPNTGLDHYSAFLDLNNDGTQDAGVEPGSNVVTGTWATLTLSTDAPTHIANGTDVASLTATVTGFSTSNPLPAGAKVVATVTGAHAGTINFTSFTCDATSCSSTVTSTTTTGGIDIVNSYLDLNNNNVQDADEMSSNTAVSQWLKLTIAPDAQSHIANGTDTASLTATIEGFNSTYQPPAGAKVVGVATGAHAGTFNFNAITCDATNCTATISSTTTTSGQDLATAYLDLNNNNTQDANEPGSNTVTSTWVASAITLTLEAQTGVGQVSDTYTVTDGAGNVPDGTVVWFQVTSGTATVDGTTTSGAANTKTTASGQVTFVVTGTVGNNVQLTAFIDRDGNNSYDAGTDVPVDQHSIVIP